MKIKKVSGKFYFVLWLTEVCELFSHSVIPDLNSAVTFSIMSDKNNLSDISLPYSDVATKKTREGSLNNLTLNNSVMEGVSHQHQHQPGAPVCSSTPDTPDTHHPPTMLHHPPPPFGYPAQYFVNPQPLTLSSDDLQKIADVVSASVRASIREEVQDLIQQMVEPIRADVNLLRQENEKPTSAVRWTGAVRTTVTHPCLWYTWNPWGINHRKAPGSNIIRGSCAYILRYRYLSSRRWPT